MPAELTRLTQVSAAYEFTTPTPLSVNNNTSRDADAILPTGCLRSDPWIKTSLQVPSSDTVTRLHYTPTGATSEDIEITSNFLFQELARKLAAYPF